MRADIERAGIAAHPLPQAAGLVQDIQPHRRGPRHADAGARLGHDITGFRIQRDGAASQHRALGQALAVEIGERHAGYVEHRLPAQPQAVGWVKRNIFLVIQRGRCSRDGSTRRTDAALYVQQAAGGQGDVRPGIGLDARARADQQISRSIPDVLHREAQVHRRAHQVIQLYRAGEVLHPAPAGPHQIVRLQFEAEHGRPDTCPRGQDQALQPGKMDVGKTGALEQGRIQVGGAGGIVRRAADLDAVAGNREGAPAADAIAAHVPVEAGYRLADQADFAAIAGDDLAAAIDPEPAAAGDVQQCVFSQDKIIRRRQRDPAAIHPRDVVRARRHAAQVVHPGPSCRQRHAVGHHQIQRIG